MRGRSYSYSPSPPRSYRRRGRSPSPRGRYGGRSRDMPTSLLVRNLRHGCKPEDLRKPFGQFGPLKDIYLPRDYYSGEPRGFGFIQYVDPADAAEAKYQMDGQILLGRELTVVFAEENRKKPADMRARERVSTRYDRRSPRRSRSHRYSRSRSPRYSRSPRRGRSRSRSRSYYSPSPKKQSCSPPPRKQSYSPSPRQQREYSRSVSPDERAHRERSDSRSPPVDNRLRSRSPYENEEQRERSRSLSR
ncbi:uncharacterized protein A4U43_C07F38750 [Asparagus officinalis]|uniref:RRM domain-containing protein n=1 Tax=Asparagus officinalis TaxID=4686 RepID=A0A5P1ENJ4_ASPOF|nr:serine/arginine-rich SC35-like splicing factor SCL33 [Asparagus officinalis]XP_020273164.1 serine/arginine-rich SC35-like splicing factor SCL33 [Asparagus officinalis]ONK65600.1 uncharacterized protein A4U43_C07F38750 [Asparagus officinalis]